MTKTNSIRRRYHVISFPMASTKLRIDFSTWWSVRIVSFVPSRYGRQSNIFQTTAGHLQWVVSRFGSRSFNICDQYSIRLSKMSSCLRNNTRFIWRSYAFVAMVYRTFFLSKTNSGVEMRFSCKVREAISSSSFSCPCYFSSDVCSLAVNGYRIWAGYGKQRRKDYKNQ